MASSEGKGVISARDYRKKVVLAPTILGFSALTKPDDKFGDPKYRALFHYPDDRAKELSIERIQAEADRMFEKWKELAKAAQVKGKSAPSAEEWFNDKLKEPGEKSKQQDPFIALSLKHKEGVSKKNGRPYVIKPSAWDQGGNLLDLAKLNLGSGSLVQPVVSVGVWTSPLNKTPAISIRLEGVRILKLVQFTGGGMEEIDEADLALIEDQELSEDLSAFMADGLDEGEGAPTEDDEDENLPF